MNFRLTKNLHRTVVDKEKKVIGLYNPIKGHHFAFVDEDLLKSLEGRDIQETEGLESLIQNNFLVPTEFSEEKYFRLFKTNLKKDVHLMYLLLTQSCNLDCGYCFESLDCWSGGTMSGEIANKAIEYFFKISSPERKIIFYGGEPLLNRDIFIRSIAKIREKEIEYGDKTKVSLVTNGTLINRNLAEFIKENDVSVSVSIDGPKLIHDIARINKMGNGSYDSVIYGYNLLREIGAKPSISCTVGSHNVNCLQEVVNFFVNELKPSSVGFNMMLRKQKSTNILLKLMLKQQPELF